MEKKREKEMAYYNIPWGVHEVIKEIVNGKR